MVGRVDAIVRTKPGGHQASPRAVGGKGGCGRAEENEVQPPLDDWEDEGVGKMERGVSVHRACTDIGGLCM